MNRKNFCVTWGCESERPNGTVLAEVAATTQCDERDWGSRVPLEENEMEMKSHGHGREAKE